MERAPLVVIELGGALDSVVGAVAAAQFGDGVRHGVPPWVGSLAPWRGYYTHLWWLREVRDWVFQSDRMCISLKDMTEARTTAITTDQGQPVYTSGGANTQDGNLKLYRCNTCRREVVWATSNNTGRKYLADVYTGQSGARFYVKASAHQCERPEDRRVSETLNARLAEVQAMRDENNAAGYPAELLAKLNEALDRAEQTIRDQFPTITK